jgi:diphosphomevalonate decarboxylase
MKEPNDIASAGVVEWRCPSNIAIIKYWGKREVQIPMNPSLSLTLQHAHTVTRMEYHHDPDNIRPDFRFTFEGQDAPRFGERIRNYLRSLDKHMPFLSRTSLFIESANTFPHSSGIASSASAFGALALCLVTLENRIKGPAGTEDPLNQGALLKRASMIARLGSGSASRSLYPGFALWGESEKWPDSSDLHAIPVTGYHKAFRGMRDSILVVEGGQKQVSSSAGHTMMETNPFSSARFQQARDNLFTLKKFLEEGNWPGFIALMEEEALSLHAMMMTSRPGFLLMQPGTLSILKKVRDHRQETGTQVGFTLDAGANVHLLYPDVHKATVREFIASELLQYCENKQVVHDEMGSGPNEISS